MAVQRILFVRNSRGITDISGAETYLINLMRGLIADGCSAELVCTTDSRRGRPLWLDRLDAAEIPYQVVDVTSMTSADDYRVARAHARELGADVIHAMDHRSDAIAAMLDRRLRIPAVASFFGWTNFPATSLRGRLYPLVDKFLMRRLRRVIVDSAYVGTRTRLPKDRVAVIPNGVDLERFNPDTVQGRFKTDWFGREDVTVVGLIGRIHPNKGILDLARAAAKLCPRFPNLRFVVLGGTPPGFEAYQAEINALIAETSLQDRFLVTNVESREIPAAIASFDITTLPSYMESLSYVMLESMAMRRPVISAKVGGHGELIEDGMNGYLIASGDVDALADRIATLAQDPNLRAQIAHAARARIEEQYSTAAMVARTRAVYEEAQRA